MPKLISLYTGAGGLDLGFEAAGFHTAVAVEMDTDAVTTLRKNRDWPVIDRDIHTVTSKEILKTASLKPSGADVLIGGPPCQPFSKSGYWASGDTLRLDDPRAGTLGAYLRVLRDTLPKAFLLENVPGLIFRSKSEGLELIQKTIAKINRDCGTSYTIAVEKLNAAHYGVPQMRERVLVVGSRDGRKFKFPNPTHGEVNEKGIFPDLKPYSSAWDALGDLENDDDPSLRIRGKWADLLPSIPEGENYLWHTNRGGGMPLFGWRRRYWSFLLKLAKNMPAWTIQAQPGPAIGPFHWTNRRLSARELCRIQTIPDDYRVIGNINTVQRQIGNAVPSALAEIIARAIRCQLLDESIDLTPTLIPETRRPIPDAERLQPVPRKYRHLAGHHEDHPGTGKGYAATRRQKEAAVVPDPVSLLDLVLA
jgi:DNA (cytosine-5)-methyltransferase 1